MSKEDIISKGFVPNFNIGGAVDDAIKRETSGLMNRGLSKSAAKSSIYVSTHPNITSNAGNLGVFNKIDESKGASQGINRARREGQSVNTYGTKSSVPSFYASAQQSHVDIPNFAEAQHQMNEAFGEMTKAAESITNSISKTDEVKQIQSISSSEQTSNTNVNVNVKGSIEAVPNAVAKAVIDWSKSNMVKGGGYFPPNRKS